MRCAHEACARWAPAFLAAARAAASSSTRPGSARGRASKPMTRDAARVARRRPSRGDRPRPEVSRLGALLRASARDHARRRSTRRCASSARAACRLGAELVAMGAVAARRSAADAGAQAGAGYLTTVDPARVRTAPGRPVARRRRGARRGADRSGRGARPPVSPVPRRCRAWRSPRCARSSPRRCEPLLVGDDAAAALLEAYGTRAGAGRAGRRGPSSLRDAAERIALAIATGRASRVQPVRCDRGCGCASTAAPRPRKSSCRRAPSGSRTASRRPSRHQGGRVMAGGTYSALSGLRTRLEQLDRLASRHRQRRHRRLQDRARPDRRGAPARLRPGAADGDRRRRRARPLDFRPGSIETTSRDLDVALEGARLLRDRDARGRALHAQRPVLAPAGRHAGHRRRRRRARRHRQRPITVGQGAISLRAATARCAPAASSPASSRSSTSATTSACAARKRGRFRAEAGVDAGRRAGDARSAAARSSVERRSWSSGWCS